MSRIIEWVKQYGRWLLFAFGISAVGLLIRHFGPALVWQTIQDAAAFLPILFLLEVCWFSLESFALWHVYKPVRKRIPLRVWIRALWTHYVVVVLLPGGRAAAELTRAALLSPYIGGGRAAAGATRFQSLTLMVNTLVTIPCLGAVYFAVGAQHALFWALLANGVATFTLGFGIFTIMRRGKIGGWLGKKFTQIATGGEDFDDFQKDAPKSLWVEMSFALAARSLQTLQYGLFLAAVGGMLSLEGSLLSQGIHLVGAAMGDLVPNQAGITEGVYTVFADALGLGDHPERAMTIALLARIVMFSVALSYGMMLKVFKAPNTPQKNEGQS